MIANLLTGSRLLIAAAFALCASLLVREDGSLSTGVAILLAALVLLEEATDLLDGAVARRLGTVSRLGGILDPLADSLARLTIYFTMALLGWITIAAPLVMTARDVIVSYTRILQALAGGKISARLSGKLKAVVQGGCMPLFILLVALGDSADSHILETVRSVATGALIAVTLWSLLDYVRGCLPALRSEGDVS